ncbi:MAG: 3-dehydroquinate synthase [Bacteroidota bacterium]
MQSILSTDYYVHFQSKAYEELDNYLNHNFHSKIFILVDSNTKKYCLPHFLDSFKGNHQFEIIEVINGEEFKNLNTCIELWNTLTQKEADRKSILINLGGGVITDMGGFVASTFKRGIRFINIPTTLLSMVDASVGGKTGIDLGVLKNQIGLFSNPEMVLIDENYLKTVTERELRSGLAEIIKYGFTFDKSLWEEIQLFDTVNYKKVADLIYRSISIKNDVVLQDMKEQNLRKTLNFGHTIGHAIESYFLEKDGKKSLTHGESVAVGMVVELYYSSKLFGFPLIETDKLKAFTHSLFGKIDLQKTDFKEIKELMIYDKKNVSGKVNFILLKDIEECMIDIQVSDDLIEEGLLYYLN